MTLLRLLPLAAILSAAPVPALAASFDCGKATTPFETAICSNPELSLADEVLAKSFATATGGLTKAAVTAMRADQRGWLDYAQRACTDDAQPLTRGSYDEAAAACLVSAFGKRGAALETSRMLGGHRFYIESAYAALPDPNEVDDPDSYYKVASHSLVVPLLDGDDPLAAGFNAYVREAAQGPSPLAPGASDAEIDDSSSSDLTISLKEVARTNRISLEVSTYWYGHGAAHGNWAVTYLHYFVPEARGLLAGDVFSGDGWEATLLDAAWTQLQAEHGEWLQVDKAEDIAEYVVDPERWSFDSPYGLIIQFQPYEVSAYAYGAPTITVPWDKLEAIAATTQDSVRYGV